MPSACRLGDAVAANSLRGVAIALSERFKKALDGMCTLPHAASKHSSVWSLPEDLAAATAVFRKLWELGERAEQDEVWHYLEDVKGLSAENASKFQDAWMTVDFCLSNAPSRSLKLPE